MVDLLLSHGADPCGYGNQILINAARGGDERIMEALLRAGPDPGERLLGITTLSGRSDIVAYIWSRIATPDWLGLCNRLRHLDTFEVA